MANDSAVHAFFNELQNEDQQPGGDLGADLGGLDEILGVLGGGVDELQSGGAHGARDHEQRPPNQQQWGGLDDGVGGLLHNHQHGVGGPPAPAVVHPGPPAPAVVHPGPPAPAVVHPGQAAAAVVHPGPPAPAVVHPGPPAPAVTHPGQAHHLPHHDFVGGLPAPAAEQVPHHLQHGAHHQYGVGGAREQLLLTPARVHPIQPTPATPVLSPPGGGAPGQYGQLPYTPARVYPAQPAHNLHPHGAGGGGGVPWQQHWTWQQVQMLQDQRHHTPGPTFPRGDQGASTSGSRRQGPLGKCEHPYLFAVIHTHDRNEFTFILYCRKRWIRNHPAGEQ
jgi:hypothetical protein